MKCIYIDPPYNTGGDGFIYKDGYQSSSWASLMKDRTELSHNLLSYDGLNFVSISDEEQANLKLILDMVFSRNYLGTIEWNSTKSVTNTALISVGHTHNFIHAKNINYFVTNRSAFRLPDTIEGFSNPDNDPRGPWKADPFQVGGERPNQLYEIVNPNTGVTYRPNKGCSWKNDYKTFQKLLSDNRIVFGVSGETGPQRKRFWSEAQERGKVAKTWWDDVETTTNGTQLLKNLFNDTVFTNPKPIGLLHKILQLGLSTQNQIVMDYFGGSGTTAHAVINLNREDKGDRQYILVEQGEYFDTVLKPRVQKVIYSKAWKDGKPIAEDGAENLQGVPQIVKVLKLESYEDTLNNLELRRSGLFDLLPENVQQDYLLNYMLNIDSRGSLLNISHFENPFDYGLNISTTSAGAYDWQKVDLVETFNYLIGANIISVDDKRDEQGFVAIECRLPNQSADEKTLIFWRDCERVGYDGLQKQFDRLGINPADSEYSQVYVNGDHTLETVWDGEQSGSLKIISIEDAFLSLMFEGDA